MNNTKNRKNVRNAGNANSTRTFVISDPDAKATDNQRRAIAHAVKNGSLPRFAEEEWKNLTKGRASEIIDELRTREGDPLATWGQKKRFLELVREGFLRGVKRETLRNLRNPARRQARDPQESPQRADQAHDLQGNEKQRSRHSRRPVYPPRRSDSGSGIISQPLEIFPEQCPERFPFFNAGLR